MNTATHIVAPRMRSLQKLEKSLKRLDLSWKVIETTARVVSPPESVGFIATLEHTRASFGQLALQMVEQLAQTHLKNCQHELASSAQVAIDILVRNLFERTADVGFIATDAPLVNYLQSPTEQARLRLHDRLTEYRNKYTVYDNILVLDTTAQCLLALQDTGIQKMLRPAWWNQVLEQTGYVEVFGPSDFFRTMGNVLLYAHRIATCEGHICGVVVLKFDLKSELSSIFKALLTEWHQVVLLDEKSRVVASNTLAFEENATLELPEQLEARGVFRHQGTEFLFAHCLTRGYQGYGGPGWSALALVRLDDAFATSAHNEANSGIDIELNNDKLKEIVAQAKSIEEDLNRVIWNGKLNTSNTSSDTALGPVFAEIGRTSRRTITAFDGAILELKRLLLRGRRAELSAHAALAVDILDRNLYERANDCRWWALSEELAELLPQAESNDHGAAVLRAGDILAHLNHLYTVYQRVALFNCQGRILAVSRDADTLAGDCAIPGELLRKTLALKNTQAYTVSSMQPHALADGEATYLFCAPIRSSTTQLPIGGIALAFNCHDELLAMLKDSLPVNTDALAVFVDRENRVLASTHPDIVVGDKPEFLSQAVFKNSGSASDQLFEWHGRSFMSGAAQSEGYREFKTSDGYREEVWSLLLSEVEFGRQTHTTIELPQTLQDSRGAHFGVVLCGSLLFALASTQVIEAVAATDMAAPPAGSKVSGLVRVTISGELSVLPAYDCCQLTGQPPMQDVTKAIVIVVKGANGKFALLVNRLVDVITCNKVAPPPGGVNPAALWISGYLHDSQANSQPIFVLDVDGFSMHPLLLNNETESMR